jgi:hypothetical protein
MALALIVVLALSVLALRGQDLPSTPFIYTTILAVLMLTLPGVGTTSSIWGLPVITDLFNSGLGVAMPESIALVVIFEMPFDMLLPFDGIKLFHMGTGKAECLLFRTNIWFIAVVVGLHIILTVLLVRQGIFPVPMLATARLTALDLVVTGTGHVDGSMLSTGRCRNYEGC